MRLSTSTWNQYYYLLSLLIVCGNIQSAVSEIIFVQRVPRGDFRDVFGFVSTNQCKNHTGFHKSGAKNMVKCECDNSYSTFLLSRKDCVANSVTKGILFDNSDCSELSLKGQNTPYIVLDLQQGNHKKFKKVKGITGKNCTVDNTLYYIDDQTGNQMQVNAGYVFSINTTKRELQWQSLPSSISNLHGRVLGLVPTGCTFSITGTPSVNKPCIILKANGSVTFSTSSVVSPTATLHPIPSTQAVSTSSVVNPTATLHPIPSTQAGTPSSVGSKPSIAVTTTTAPIQSSSVPVKPTPVQSSNTPYHTQTVPGASTTPANNFSPTASKRKDKQSSPIGAIVGSVMAIIAIVVIIVVIIIWRRRKTTSGQNSKPQKGPNTPENPTYANGSEIIDLSKQKQAGQNTDKIPKHLKNQQIQILIMNLIIMLLWMNLKLLMAQHLEYIRAWQ